MLGKHLSHVFTIVPEFYFLFLIFISSILKSHWPLFTKHGFSTLENLCLLIVLQRPTVDIALLLNSQTHHSPADYLVFYAWLTFAAWVVFTPVKWFFHYKENEGISCLITLSLHLGSASSIITNNHLMFCCKKILTTVSDCAGSLPAKQQDVHVTAFYHYCYCYILILQHIYLF